MEISKLLQFYTIPTFHDGFKLFPCLFVLANFGNGWTFVGGTFYWEVEYFFRAVNRRRVFAFTFKNENSLLIVKVFNQYNCAWDTSFSKQCTVYNRSAR